MDPPTSTSQWLLTNHPKGTPTTTGDSPTFTLETTKLPSLEPNQVLVKVLYLSNDPAQRGWIDPSIPPSRLYVPPVPLHTPMRARALASVVSSTSPAFPTGTLVRCTPGWVAYAVLPAGQVQPVPEAPAGLGVTHWLGVLGGTGLTAMYGLEDVVGLKAGETVVVSGAGGAVGSVVVQIAKRVMGAGRVVGIAGGGEKCRWVESLGADVCVDYKAEGFKDELLKETEGGVDVYFDNVGGEILDFMLARMNREGRIAACGAIADYNAGEGCVMKNYFQVITMRLLIKGFIVLDASPQRTQELQAKLKKAIEEGKLKVDKSETVVETKFDGIPNVWLRLFEGKNTGKLVTKIVD